MIDRQKLRIRVDVAHDLVHGDSGKNHSFKFVLKLKCNIIDDVGNNQEILNHNSTIRTFVYSLHYFFQELKALLLIANSI